MALAVTTVPVQGKDVVLEISTDNGTTWKTLVCLIKQAFEMTRSLNETETQCGTIPGVGSLKKVIPFEAAVNVNVVGEQATLLSYKDLNAIMESGSAIMARQKHPNADGAIFNNSGKCYLTDLKLDLPINNVCTFSGNLSLF